ncbi:nitrogen regulation protein NR(II) [Psychrobacter pygoscelis]|uniref:nitrogen regulation protein NR(II) n=1 Tax=Psychrobacter pygoscelis TaxID=2488563 RepID=UPI003100D5F0
MAAQSSTNLPADRSVASISREEYAMDLAVMSKHLFTAILWTDEFGEILWANTQAEQLFSASQARLLNRSALDLLRPYDGYDDDKGLTDNTSDDKTTIADPLSCQLKHALTYQQPFIDHDQLIFGVSHSVMVDYSVTPVDHQGQYYFLIEIWEKNRQSRISQEQRQQEQHTIARQMLRAVAHEVKNPLAGIRGAAQLLGKQLKKLAISDDKVSTYAGIIISETDRLTQLIGQMLGSNRLANWQSVNIHEPLEHVLTLTHSQHPDIVIERDYDLSLPELTADKDQLIQVFLNLMNNACEAMLEQDTAKNYIPTIKVQTRVVFQHTIGSVQHKQALKIDIQDNGFGIDPNMIDQIFLPLVTGRATGTGLGLALVQDMISRHHGAIDVQSKAGNTTFTVYLPFSQ